MAYTPFDMKPDIRALEESVAFYEGQVADVRERLERIQTQLRGAEANLEIAQNFLALEKQRWNGSSEANGLNGSNLKEMALQVVREKGRVTAAEIATILEARGWQFESTQYGRAIHSALMHAPVRKVAPNTYEILEGRMI
jgi:hypothetical protein